MIVLNAQVVLTVTSVYADDMARLVSSIVLWDAKIPCVIIYLAFALNGCNEKYFMSGEECRSCSNNCASCRSMDKCTQCEIGFWELPASLTV